ncbi:MAG: AhpC/TSA family protein [Prevotella sp.]|nr:AhpC/TSA family protein [Prevotella sp.]
MIIRSWKWICPVLLGLLIGCQPKQVTNYTLSGMASDMSEGDTLYIVTDLGGSKPIDTLFVNQGRFQIEGFTPSSPILCYLYDSSRPSEAIPFFLEPGNISIDRDSTGTSRISGTSMNDALQSVNDSVMNYDRALADVMSTLYGGSPTKVEQQSALQHIEALTLYKSQYLYRTAEQNIGNKLGRAILTCFDDDIFSPEQRQSLISQLPDSLRSHSYLQDFPLSHDVLAIDALPDLRMPTSLGGEVSLLEEVRKNTFTIIDFWASWSIPSLRDMSKLGRLYRSYHQRGVGMIGISMDMDAGEWRRTIEKTGQPWLQLCDLKGWESDMAESLRVRVLPHTLLVDSKGTVLASGLSADELEVYLEQAVY